MRFNARLAGLAAMATVVGGGIAGVMGITAPPASAQAAPGTGHAYGAYAAVTLLPGVLTRDGLNLDTGVLAPSSTSGPASASVVDVPLRGVVTAQAITSSTSRTATTVTARAAIVDLRLPVLAAALGGTPSVQVLRAKCTGTGMGTAGSSEIAGVNLGRLGTVPVTGAPNQTIDVPQVARIVLNEQVKDIDGSITVTALHVTLLGGSVTGKLGSGDIRLASATCGMGPGTTTPPTTPPTVPSTPTVPTPPPHQPTVTPNAPADQGGHQVRVVPAGAPQTGDGSLAGRR
ncbi:choice-of-anchor P family protein [Labedaea rhizosphaerae]|uniref:Uncharacterized protein n=1 Tax=Labedaea rhizosphaerae TaxID=598644 RepID=A0A4R6RZS9_LABRH|nr:choice-of-anchor P family protein [Labedaea rhizosphaerae]TDP91835.1 hypothetical protein EV186_10844 [Labedaea rhizosphaerae]